MLNTFENAERHHLRRKERDRHLQMIETIASSPAADFDPAAAVDALNGTPLSPPGSPSRSPTGTHRRRRSNKLHVILGVCFVFVVVLSSALLSTRNRKQDGAPLSSSTGSRGPDTTKKDMSRYDHLFSMILDWQVTPRDVLEDETSSAGRALHWLAFEDTLVTGNPETLRTRFALATLYYSSADPNKSEVSWVHSNHWLSSYPVCLWHGVQCLDEDDTVGLVKSVNLTSNGLIGTIPAEISLLQKDCQSIDLSKNELQGAIPDLAPLKNLQQLYLGPNKLSSTIPNSVYALSHLTHLYLNDCDLSGSISSALGQLSHLQGLSLHNNFLTGTIPPSVGELTDLRVLYLDANVLTGSIPTTIGHLSRLIDLRLRRNRLRGPIASEIERLRLLQVLYLDTNELTGELPASAMGNLPLMRELHLYENHLSGTLPTEVGQMALLSDLYLDQNLFRGLIPSTLGNLDFLETLYLFENHLTGPLPTNLGSMESLKLLRLNNNKLEGEIPTELGRLSHLQTLYLHNNTFTGEVPIELLDGNLQFLERVSFHGNRLTGEVHCEKGPELFELTADCYSQDMSCECCTRCFY